MKQSGVQGSGGFKGILRGVRCTKSLRVLFLHRRPPSWTTLVLYSRAVFLFNEPALGLLCSCASWFIYSPTFREVYTLTHKHSYTNTTTTPTFPQPTTLSDSHTVPYIDNWVEGGLFKTKNCLLLLYILQRRQATVNIICNLAGLLLICRRKLT